MKKSLFLPLAAAALLFAFSAQGAGLGPGDPEAGQTKSAPCQGCHGPDGNSMVPQFPKLAGQGEKYIIKQLQEFKAGDRNNATMAPFAAGLSEEDMADLAAYFARQERSVGAANESMVALGEDIYRGGITDSKVAACAGCHGPVGNGNPAAVFPALSGQHADYTEAQLNAFASGERNNDPNRMMQLIAVRMTPEQRRAVAEYIAGLH